MSDAKIIAARKSKTIFTADGKVYKSFDDVYGMSDVLREAYNMANVQETGLKVPELLEVRPVDGKWTIIMNYVVGDTMAELMEAHPEKMDEYLVRFVDIQLDLERRNVPRLARIKEKMHRKIDQSGLDATTRYELHTRLDSMEEKTRLCHGDFNPSNIVITPDDEAYVLDWSHATQGDPAEDAARTYLLFKLDGRDDLAEKYLKLYTVRGDVARQRVEKWLAIVAASQMVKGNESERELLKPWTEVVEYE